MTGFISGAMSLAFFFCYLCMNESPFFYSISPISININFFIPPDFPHQAYCHCKIATFPFLHPELNCMMLLPIYKHEHPFKSPS